MLKVVHVEWQDPAFADNGWMQQAEFKDWIGEGIARSDSVGFLIYEDDVLIVLAQSIGETQIAGGLKINRASIKKIRKLDQVAITLEEFE